MSLSQAVVCDGCGATQQAIRLDKGQKHLIPLGWLRLSISARRSDHGSRLGEVEVCSSECATFATKKFFEQVPDER